MGHREDQNACDIAVVGVSALFPGSLDKTGFWKDIMEGTDLITEVPSDHWLLEDYYDPDPKAQDKTYGNRGAFLKQIDFSPMEFGLPPSNLTSTDTSQLLALVVAKQVLEDASTGQFDAVDRDRISVILGVASATQLVGEMGSRMQRPIWVKALRESGLPEDQVQEICNRISDTYSPWQESTFPGLLGNVVAGRIANRLNLGGTNCVIDAACASSLSAITMAVMELQMGHSDLVISGGVDALNDILMYMCFSKTPALSPTGDCRPFSDQADGTILGEGLGMVALRRLSDAERDGNRIYAVLKGIGSSSDGQAKSVYAPNGEGQAKALRRAYERAGYSPATVELVEAHGTGTKAGDVAEFEGLRRVFDDNDAINGETQHPWCALGTVKSQIGHTKAAAGSAGLFKVVMALHHKVLPPTIKVDRPNPNLRISESPFYLNTRARPWIRDESHPRRASVSAFGFGGSNFHVTLEEYRGPNRAYRIPVHPSALFVWSADTAPDMIRRCEQVLSDAVIDNFTTLSRLSQGKFDVKHRLRLAIVAKDLEDLRAKLRDSISHIRKSQGSIPSTPHGVYYACGPAAHGKIAFLFPGQGSQYVDMGADLAMAFPCAREVWDKLGTVKYDGQVLHHIVFPQPVFTESETTTQQQQLTRTEWAQPAIGMVSQAALAVLLELGIEPNVLGGHSFGELTALCAAGVFDGSTLLAVARKRGELMAQAGSVPATMVAVFGDAAHLIEILHNLTLDVVIANYNSPSQVVISGPVEHIEMLEQHLKSQSIRFQRLPVSTAFHSPIVESSIPEFSEFLKQIPVCSPNNPVYSNTTGALYAENGDDIISTLANQIAKPVLFEQQIRTMYEAGVRTFVEVGPSSTLTGLVKQCLPNESCLAVSVDKKGQHGVTSLWHALAQLATAGVWMDFAALWRDVEPVPEHAPPKPSLSVKINGANYGKKYPPANGFDGVPKPNPTRKLDTETSKKEQIMSQHEFTPSTPRTVSQTDYANILQTFQVMQQQTLEAHMAYQQTMAAAHTAFLRASETTFLSLTGLMTGDFSVAQMLHSQGTVNEWALPPMPTAPHTVPSPIQLTSVQPQPVPPVMHPAPVVAAPSVMAAPPALSMQQAPMPAIPAVAVASVHQANPTAPTIPPVKPAAPIQSAAADSMDIQQLLLSVIAAKTGYPVEMLQPEMSLEMDLGIDSIKRVEILSAMQDHVPHANQIQPQEMAVLQTIGEIADYLRNLEKKNLVTE